MRLKILCVILLSIMSVNVFAQDYYVDSILGNDQNSGTSIEDPWKTLAKISTFRFLPGDIINLKRGQVWEERLNVTSSGSEGYPIVYRGYGSSDSRPLIKLSNEFDNWELAIDESNKKIWIGQIPGVKNSWGAVRFGKRLLKYLEYKTSSKWSAPNSIGDMEEGFYYAPLNSWKFYLRFDGGDPGPVEIGSRPYGISIENKNFIIIDGIDVYGPGGNAYSGSASSSHQIYISSSNDIYIKNCEAKSSFTKSIFICNGSSRCIIDNVKCSDQGSTGIYLYQAGSYNKVVNCEVFETGSIKTDFGDMGCIGFESSGENNVVEDCYVHDNGFFGVDHIDAAISIFNTPKTSVKRCYVKNSADKAIMLSENSDESAISYCIIDNWGVHGSTITAWPSVEGVRLGGGGGGIVGCKVYNNLFINGSLTEGDYAALTIQYRINRNTKIKNNIFYDIKNVYDIKAESKDNFEGWEISNNLFFRNSGNAIFWQGKKYSIDKISGDSKGFFTYDTGLGASSLVGDPLLLENFKGLKALSPCIDKGVEVGMKKDFNGNVVPKGSGVDIGPFEYDQNKINPPANIKIDEASSSN